MEDGLPAYLHDGAWRRRLATATIRWFDKHHRDLPWRGTQDLYRIWVSEVMLQQTQVATVIPYYERFLRVFPDVAPLAAAPEELVLRQWEGLGYYRRARQLHAAAKVVVRDFGGEFPRTYEEVRSLPGIGRYTAGAILSLGLDARLPILEANTVRLLSRLLAYRGDVASTSGQKILWAAAEKILPAKAVGKFNQGLMELGSQVCTPREPNCRACPLAAICPTREGGLQEIIPRPKVQRKYEDVTEVAVVIRRGRTVLLRRRGESERWAGLWDFPRFATSGLDESGRLTELLDRTVALTGVRFDQAKPLTTLRHGVTRFRITLHCYEARYRANGARQNGTIRHGQKWIAFAHLDAFPLSTTARKIARMIARPGGDP